MIFSTMERFLTNDDVSRVEKENSWNMRDKFHCTETTQNRPKTTNGEFYYDITMIILSFYLHANIIEERVLNYCQTSVLSQSRNVII